MTELDQLLSAFSDESATSNRPDVLASVLDEFQIHDPAVRRRIGALAQLESNGDPAARGPKISGGMHDGDQARGLLQIMPKTARDYPEYNIDDERDAARAGVRYFMDNYDRFGDLDLATVAHHGGPGAAEKRLRTGSAGSVDRATGLATDDYLARIRAAEGGELSSGAAAPSISYTGDQGQFLTDTASQMRADRRQAAADASPVSTSLERGWEGLKHNAGLFVDNLAGDSEGVAQRVQDKRAWDLLNPAPTSSQQFMRDWADIPEGEYGQMLGAFLSNPGGAFNQVVEQTPNSAPGMAFQIAALALASTGLGAPAALALQGIAAFAGNVLPEGGAIVEEMLAKDGVDIDNAEAVAAWAQANRGRLLQAGVTKAGVISVNDALAAVVGTRIIAGPTKRFLNAERTFAQKSGVDLADAQAMARLRGSAGYQQAMAPEAQRLLAATTGAQKVMRGIGGVAVETVGEGTGEYTGSLAATGEASGKDAILEGVMGGATSVGMTTAQAGINALNGPDATRAQLKKLANSPLTNAANAAAAATPANPSAPQAGGALVPAGEPELSPEEARIERVRSFVEDKDFIRGVRATEGMGKESVNEVLSAYAKARNPNVDPMIRERALSELEAFIEAFNNRPNFQYRGQAGQPTPNVPATTQPQGGEIAPAAAPADDGMTLDGEVIERPGKLAGANPNQLAAPPVHGLASPEAMEARRNADADYEQAFQDLVKADALGQSGAELEAVQRRMIEAEARLNEIAQTLAGSEAAQAEARRRRVLAGVLANPEVQNHEAAFAAELGRQGFRDAAVTEAERARIARFMDVRDTFTAPPEVEPSAPNELDPYASRRETGKPAGNPAGISAQNQTAEKDVARADQDQARKLPAVPVAPAQEPAPARADALAPGAALPPAVAPAAKAPTVDEIREAVASGARLDGNKLTIGEAAHTLKGPLLAAAKNATRQQEATNDAAALDAPSDQPGRSEPAGRGGAAPDGSGGVSRRKNGDGRPGAADSGIGQPAAVPPPVLGAESVEADALSADEELDDALSHLGDVLGDVFGTQLKITGKEYGAKDLLPALSKVIELLVKKGFRSFREAVGASSKAMRSNAATAPYLDQVSARQWKAAYNSIAEFHDGTDSEDAVNTFSADDVAKIVAGAPAKAPKAEIKSDLDAKAHEAATSPLNDRKEPTEGQIEAGNYKVGKARILGMDVSIENPKGSKRKGVDKDGKPWENLQHAHYGYFLGTEAKDGDHLDVYLADDAERATKVWVIDQIDEEGRFDEHKIVVGPDTEAAARQAYLDNYREGWTGLGAITSMPVEAFKAWALDGKKKRKALAYVEPEKVESRVDDSPRNSAPMDSLDGFSVGDRVVADSRTFGEVVIDKLFTRAMAGFDEPLTLARIKRADGGTTDILTSELRKVQPDKQEPESEPFDSEKWDRERAERVEASKAAGHKHLDQVPSGVESMRGREIYYVHDLKQRGVVRTVDNNGNVYVDWADEYSAEKELASETLEDNASWLKSSKDRPYLRIKRGGKVFVMRSTLGRSDLKDYVFADSAPADQNPVKETSAAESAPSEESGADSGLPIKQFEHTKTGKAQYVVQLPAKVEKEVYQAVNRRAIANKGRWSSYAKDGAIAGFLFQTEANAQAFAADPVVMQAAGADGKATLTYDEFKAEMQRLLNESMKYKPSEVGAGAFAEKMADLSEQHPEFQKQLDAESDASETASADDDLGARVEAAYVAALDGKHFSSGLRTTAAKMFAAIRDGNAVALYDILNPSNKVSREAFKSLTGISLPKGVLATQNAVSEFVSGAQKESPAVDLDALADEVVAIYSDKGKEEANAHATQARDKYGLDEGRIRELKAKVGARLQKPDAKAGAPAAAQPDDIGYDETVTRQEPGDEPTGNDRGNESALAPVSSGAVRGTESEGGAGEGSPGVRGPDAEGDGGSAEDARDEPAGGVAGEPEPVLPEGPDVVDVAGQERPLDEVAESVKNDPPASEPKPKFPARFGDNPGNYRITDADAIGTGTTGERIRANMAAVRLVLALESENRYPTREEQAVLAKYVGWGGLKNVFKGDNSSSKQERDAHAELKKILTAEQLFWMGQSVLDAHYTSPTVIRSIYSVLSHFGVEGGRFLEPTVGVGNFIGLMPEPMASSAKWFGSEIDPVTSLIAKHLYPDAQILPATGFQDAEFAYGRMDVAIGNPPFGDQRITDTNKKRAAINGFKIHNYIISKAAMHLRPGGVMSFVVTSRFLDTANPEAREFLAKNFRLLAAIRLPNTAFAENAGTEVTTDLIFLQRRREGMREVEAEDLPWLDTKGRMLNEDGDTVELNRYFAENPAMMLGKPSMAGTMYGSRSEKGEFTLMPREGETIDEGIAALIDGPLADLRGVAKARASDADAAAAAVEFNREDVPIGGFFDEGGNVIQRIDDDEDGNTQFRQLTADTPWTAKQTLGVTRLERIKGMLELRAIAYDLMADERADAAEDRIEAKRAALNKAYDAFVDKFGFLNDNANRTLMDADPRIEFGLEADYRKEITKAKAKTLGQEASPAQARKASLLKERVFFPKEEVDHADSPADGYAVSLSEKGRLDLDYIAAITDSSVEDVIKALSTGEKPLIFKDPGLNKWVQEDEYLSGNVKEKLKVARGAGLAANIRALEAVQPADIAPENIHAEFGATWIRAEVYEDFLKLFGYGSARVAVMPKSGAVEAVSVGGAGPSPFRADIENPDFSIDSVFNAVANRRQMVAYDGHGDTRTVNRERTENLARIREKLIAIWKDWIKSDPVRLDLLAKDYNEIMNTTVERKFDGVTHLRTVGASPDISLRNSQKIAAWRMVQSSTVLMDQVVGAGKTIAIVTGLMERKRLGLSKKPMVVVPNHLVGQWARDWIALYPGANVLAATEKDFQKQNRRRLFARIATGKFDAIIVGHSSFGFIPVSREAEVEFVMKEVEHLEAALTEAKQSEGGKKGNGDSRRVRGIKNRIAKRMEKIRELQDKPRDNVATFEDMGVDYLAVDEMHEFKNLEYATTLSNVAGMGSPEGSKKAFDLYMKMRLLQEWGGGIAGATGTPISNSMVEMYSLLRYLNPGALAARNLEQFDAWVKAFASIELRDEYTASGKIKQRTVMAAFNNLPELLQMYKQVADTVTMSDLKRIYAEQMRAENAEKGTAKREEFPVPKVKGGERRLDIGAPTPEQVEFMDYLIARADILDKLKGRAKQEYASIDNALWLMNDARKMSLDVRIIEPSVADSENSKVSRAARNIKRIYDATDADLGAQLVFCDLSTPSKSAGKDAGKFIKDALKSLGMESDSAVTAALDGKSYEDQWAVLRMRAEMQLDGGRLGDAQREKVEAFLESVGDDETSALRVADSGFSVYDDLKKKLIAAGIAEREIAFIHDATTSEKKRELFDLVNAGKVRVLIGSSAKMGAGTNVQSRLVALHHMDAPWRPSDIEQREGRIIRQGNMFYERNPDRFEVEIVAYSTERTFDAQMWGVLARKAGFLEQFRQGLRTIKEEGVDAASYAEFMAEATGDQIFRDKLRLERELSNLEADDRSSRMKRLAAQQLIDSAQARLDKLGALLEEARRLESATLESVTFEGKIYRDDLNEVIEAEMEAFREERAQFESDDEAYRIARKAWEDAAGTERGRAPTKPKPPEIPEFDSPRVREKSEWAQLIDLLTKRMELVGDGESRAYEIVDGSGVVIEVEAAKYNETEAALYVGGERVTSGRPRGPQIGMALTPHRMRGQIRSRVPSVERDIRLLKSNVGQAKLTLEHVKPVDEALMADLRKQYEDVKVAVDEVSARMAAERAQRSNRFIEKDKRRFSGANAASEVRREALETAVRSYKFRTEGTGSTREVSVAEGAKPVVLDGLDGLEFFALNDKDRKGWFIIESSTGLSIGSGATRKAALDVANERVASMGAEKIKSVVEGSPQITDEERADAVGRFSPPAVARAPSPAIDGMPAAEVRDFARAFAEAYPSAPDIFVAHRYDNLPAEVRADLESQGVPRSVRGVLFRGTAYVVAGNHDTMADVEETIFHEVVGHAGVRKLFGPQFVQKLNQVFMGLGGVTGLQKIMDRRGQGGVFAGYVQRVLAAKAKNPETWTDDLARAILTEEVYAHIAERGSKGLMDKFLELVGMVRAFLRKAGMSLAELGESDLLYTLSQARAMLQESGSTAVMDGVAVVSDRTKEKDDGQAGTAAGELPGQENADRAVGGAPKLGWAGATRIRGKSGRPATVFRGAGRKLSAEDFAQGALGVASNNPTGGLGVWLSLDPDDAAQYGEVENFHLDMRNPKVYRTDSFPAFDSVEEAQRFAKNLQRQGYDGIVVDYREIGGPIHFVAFSARQVVYPRPDGGPVVARDGEDGNVSRMDDRDRVASEKAPDPAGDGKTGGEPPAVQHGYIRLFHGGGDGVSEILGGFGPGNVFGGVFASESMEAAASHGTGAMYYMDLPEDSILTQRALDYDIGYDDQVAALRKAMPWLEEGDVDIAYTAAIEDKAHSVDEDDLMRIFREDDVGSAGWEAQRVRGLVAKELGYEAVTMADEHGTSVLVLPGAKINRMNEPSAPAGPGAPAVARVGGAEAPSLRATLRARIADLFDTSTTFNWWQKTVGSQYGKAKSSPEFGRVYAKAHAFIDDVSRFANEAADRARGILPHMDTLADIVRGANLKRQWSDAKDYREIAKAIFEGTLADKAYTARELRDDYGLSETQIGLYDEFRAAVDFSLDTLAASELARAARVAQMELADQGMGLDESVAFYEGQLGPGIDLLREALEDLRLRHRLENEALDAIELDETFDLEAMREARRIRERRQAAEIAQAQAELKEAEAFRDSFRDKVERVRDLQHKGYAPLMRFGQFTVDVVRLDEDGKVVMNDEGEPDRPFFAMFESEAEAKESARILAEEYPGYTVNRGVMSVESSRLYAGLTPETAEMFGRLLGTDASGAFQAYLKQAVANRSAMKRLIQRKGMEGFSQDVPRVLAAFITSNARLASGNWHFGEMAKAVEKIPQHMGDVKDQAIRLMQYIQNPQEEAAAVRGFLFFSFLGGSVASAAVNMTQTFSTTIPYLHQFGGAKTGKVVAKAMADAVKVMRKGFDGVADAELRAALHRASEEGIVDPQEIHLLMAESGGGGNVVGRLAGAVNKDWQIPAERMGRAFTHLWGSMFGAAEKYNRHVAFLAAWELAPAGRDRYEFAKEAVTETQFDYTKASRSNWARGPIGATLFTFKSFLVNYMEFLARLPRKEQALALAVLVLLSGLSGLPGMDDLDDVIDSIGQKLGYNWNNKAGRHAWLVKTLGTDGADFVQHGVSSFLPLDVSARLGMGNIVPGTGALKKSNVNKSRDAEEFFGPAGSVASGAIEVFDDIGAGKGFFDLMRPVSPKSLNDIRQAIDMVQTGAYRDRRGREVVDVSLGDAFWKAIGFHPNKVAEPKRVERMLAQTNAMQRAVRADIHELRAQGIYEGDPEKSRLALEMVRDWNRKNPESPIHLNPASIAARVNAMRKTSAERLVKATPRDMRGMVRAGLQVTDG